MPDYITRKGMQRLKKRLNKLIKERPQIIKDIATAREMGDLSENAEYKAAREKQRQLENEFNQLKARIAKLTVIDTENIPKDAVRFGAYVTITNPENNRIRKIRVVGDDEVFDTDDEYKRKSVSSPLVKSMIGKKVGQTITVKAPGGEKKYKLINIK